MRHDVLCRLRTPCPLIFCGGCLVQRCWPPPRPTSVWSLRHGCARCRHMAAPTLLPTTTCRMPFRRLTCASTAGAMIRTRSTSTCRRRTTMALARTTESDARCMQLTRTHGFDWHMHAFGSLADLGWSLLTPWSAPFAQRLLWSSRTPLLPYRLSHLANEHFRSAQSRLARMIHRARSAAAHLCSASASAF